MTKSKKWLHTILPILFLLLSLLPIKETFAAETDPVYDKIIQKGELVVGLSADYAPYEFHAKVDGEDKIVGFDISIAQKIADDLGVKLKIEELGFDALLGALKTGKI
ncbi:transporter substrate-binding domain-containing protein, partial [Enterococcus faecium]